MSTGTVFLWRMCGKCLAKLTGFCHALLETLALTAQPYLFTLKGKVQPTALPKSPHEEKTI
jgi:hypothetical protein